ncbi:DUF4064 domain-containing protein [Halobacillus litoralis]|uniref:DUF4064 domain-containing protein n=1 Tax=Halobacillus litoralis TaxID=45668 RepID=A0A410MCZ1_9BACI|nr:DUF4064 domain-containing protein [Halobacillus litoralis]QAS52543.1 hypothetical protein HLI_10100 [Halobacillus litoralis]
MKRTVEIVISVIGMVLFGLPVLLSGLMLNMKDNEQFKQEMESFMNSPEMQAEGGAGGINIGEMINMLGSFALFAMIAAIIAIGLGILSAVFLKGNKKPKAAGIILIITAIIMTFATFGMGLFGGVAYLIAGIVALARKPKTPVEEGATINY